MAGKLQSFLPARRFPKKELLTLLAACLVFYTTFTLCILALFFTFPKQINQTKETAITSTQTEISFPQIDTPSPQTVPQQPKPTTTQTNVNTQPTPTPTTSNKAIQIDETTWTVQVESDAQTGSAQDVINALNSYRSKNGKAPLAYDQKLASYAQSRADLFASQGGTDKHAGFNSFLDGNGFNELGFNSIGENSSHGYQVSGQKLIEEVYASDAPHNNNQLADKWTHVGVGVNGVATDIIFAGNKQ